MSGGFGQFGDEIIPVSPVRTPPHSLEGFKNLKILAISPSWELIAIFLFLNLAFRWRSSSVAKFPVVMILSDEQRPLRYRKTWYYSLALNFHNKFQVVVRFSCAQTARSESRHWLSTLESAQDWHPHYRFQGLWEQGWSNSYFWAMMIINFISVEYNFFLPNFSVPKKGTVISGGLLSKMRLLRKA